MRKILLPLGIGIILTVFACGQGADTDQTGTPEVTIQETSPSPTAYADNTTFDQVDDPPVAENKTASTPQDTAVNISLTAIDADSTCASPEIDVVALPAHGTIYLAPPVGCVNANPDDPLLEGPPSSISMLSLYVPDNSFCGSDSFTYAAVNDGDFSVVATVTIRIACPP